MNQVTVVKPETDKTAARKISEVLLILLGGLLALSVLVALCMNVLKNVVLACARAA